MVMAAGLEPATYSLEGCCSIQLSYATPQLTLESFAITHKLLVAGQTGLEPATYGFGIRCSTSLSYCPDIFI